MSIVRDNVNKKVFNEINKIIPKSLKKNLIEYDSNSYEKQIEDKINQYNLGKKEKEKNEFNNSIDKNTNKIKKSLRTSSAVDLRKNKNAICSFNNDINNNSNSPSKYYTKNNKKNKESKTPFRNTKLNNDKFKDIYNQNLNESSNSSFIQENKEKKPKTALNLDDMLKRFEENKKKSNYRKDNIKKNIEAENSKRYNFTPEITKSDKYNNNNNNENVNFLKRVEIYKFVSDAKKTELKQKEKQKFDNKNTNNNNKPQKKISLKEVQKNIDEKLKLQKIKDQERQEKHLRKLRQLEENEISKCTFNPKLFNSSIKMNNSIVRSGSQINKIDFNKSTSVSRIIETDVSKKIDTSENNLNLLRCNLKKETSFKRDYSMTRLEKIPEYSINISSNWDLILSSPEKEKKAAFVKQNFINSDINITKKESEIMMELLRGKFQ